MNGKDIKIKIRRLEFHDLPSLFRAYNLLSFQSKQVYHPAFFRPFENKACLTAFFYFCLSTLNWYRIRAMRTCPEMVYVGLVAIVENRIAAMGHLRIVSGSSNKDLSASTGVFVIDKYQNKGLRSIGLGRLLTRRTIEEARREGVSKIKALVQTTNTRCLCMLQRLGFKIAGESKSDDFWKNRYFPSIILELNPGDMMPEAKNGWDPANYPQSNAGIVGYANYQGLGIMTHDLKKYLGIGNHLIVSGNDKGIRRNLAPGSHVCKRGIPTEQEIKKFLEKIDTVIAVETPFSSILFKMAKQMGKRTVLFPMWEWFDPAEKEIHDYVDLFVCISRKCYNEIPYPAGKKVYLPYPVHTGYFPDRKITGAAKTFLHTAGFGGFNWRKGTNETVAAFRKVEGNIRLVLRTQIPVKNFPCYEQIISDSRIEVREGILAEQKELYEEGDVLICPHHYDGHNLAAEEGMACGLPVITTDAEPMNEFNKDKTLLVKVENRLRVPGCKHPNVFAHIVSINDLVSKITWCTKNDLSEISRSNRKLIEEGYSWKKLKGLYMEKIFGK